MSDTRPSRRAVLAGTVGTVGALLVGCTSGGKSGAPDRTDPDDRVRAAVAAEVRRLATLYDATLARHPALRPVLEPLRAETAAHRSALGDARPLRRTDAPVLPVDAAQAQALLARAERSAADAQVGRLAGASPGLARLVASVAASEAVHAALLERG